MRPRRRGHKILACGSKIANATIEGIATAAALIVGYFQPSTRAFGLARDLSVDLQK